MSLRRRTIALIPVSTLACMLIATVAFAPTPAVAQTSDDPLPITPELVYATSGTVHNSLSGSTAFDPIDDRTWVGFCDPAEVDPEESYGEVIIEACDESPSSQRMVWTFDDQNVLAELSADDIVSARFQMTADLAWVDEVDCRQGALELYTGADWSQEPTAVSTYAPSGCDGGARTWNGYFSFDATELAKQAASGDGSLTVGVKAADETCMACGWNRIKVGALQITFNRAPADPASIRVGTSYPGDLPCTSTPQWLNSDIYASAYVADPDTPYHSGETVTATFEVFPAGQSPDGTPIFQRTATERYADARIAIAIPPDVLNDGALYDLWITSRDGYGKESGPVRCTFGVDRTDPEPPTITPVVGGDAVYVATEPRGGAGVPGYFWISGGGSDVATYRFSGGTSASCGTGSAAPATDTTGFSFTPDSRAVFIEGRVVACAVDRAGNWSQTTTYVFDVGSSDTAVATPPAITVSGASSYGYGSTYTSDITLSADAATPYGEVTVSEGSTVLGDATFDARTKSVTIPAKRLSVGSHTLTYTYQAFPGAPRWSTRRSSRWSVRSSQRRRRSAARPRSARP
ncbi:hypothetical protein ACFVJS_09355 [Nocardioides sp. NPDC057772]|uniref:hypothetical protein n=1 Tax=Nocardioides sp. NPDC057772 TaxID=3346245 RepID=UPI00366DEBED